MNRKILGLLAVGIMAGPAVQAQVTTLSYQGALNYEASATYLPSGFAVPPTDVLPSSSFVGDLFASLTLVGDVKTDDFSIAAFSFAVGGYDYVGQTKTSIWIPLAQGSNFGSPVGPQQFCDQAGGCIRINLNNVDQPVGASVSLLGSNLFIDSDSSPIGPIGTSISIGNLGNSMCRNKPIPPGLYTGATINPCALSGGSTQTAWTVRTTSAPEIDPASAVSGLTLLLGGLAVLRGRRTLRVRLG